MESPGEIDIHQRERRRRRIEEILKESDICQESKDLILEYVRYRAVESGISLLRQEKIISNLMVFASFLGKSFREASKNDIQQAITKVYGMLSNKRKGETIADSTKNAYCKIFKKFFCWLKKDGHPEESDWLKPPKYAPKRLTKHDKLFWEDVEKLSRAATNKRDFLLPQLLFDSGARIEEILTLRLKDVEIVKVNTAKEGDKPKIAAKIHIRKSKTDIRSPMVYKCVPALIDWMDNHPLKNDTNAPLLVNSHKNHNAMSYKQARTTLVILRDRAKLNKRVNPHTFRKSACSYCGDIGLGDAQIDKRFGWKIGSSVKKSYLFPEEDKANEAYLCKEGATVETIAKGKEEPAPKLCWWCNTVNPVGRDFCVNPKCRQPLTPVDTVLGDEKKIRDIVLGVLQDFLSNPSIGKEFDKFASAKKS